MWGGKGGGQLVGGNGWLAGWWLAGVNGWLVGANGWIVGCWLVGSNGWLVGCWSVGANCSVCLLVFNSGSGKGEGGDKFDAPGSKGEGGGIGGEEDLATGGLGIEPPVSGGNISGERSPEE